MKRIIQAGRNAKLVTHSDHSGVIIDGEEYYRAFVDVALGAERYLIMSGWQFNSDVQLIRGQNAVEDPQRPTTLLRFLNWLCERKPELSIYVLAWDFNMLFAFEREWMQRWLFHWSTNERIHFRFDGKHAMGASQHRKFVVADGRYAFLGGMDICESRWDTRKHLPEDPMRVTHLEEPYKPYHDVQALLTGDAAKELAAHFEERWCCVSDEKLVLPEALPVGTPPVKPTVALPAGPVALSRTQSECPDPPLEQVLEIRKLYSDAILAAERLIYIENQYFTAESVFRALCSKMQRTATPLEIAIMLPRTPEAPKEQLALGVRQSRMIRSLREQAKKHGHHLEVYYAAAKNRAGEQVPTYIHSKLIVVDDRFLTVGSANTTNRSLGLDEEINASWEATPDDRALCDGIRKVRCELLAEHCQWGAEHFERIEGLVARLEEIADRPDTRLFRHPADNLLDRSPVLEAVLPADIGWDPDAPFLEEEEWEQLMNGEMSIFGRAFDRVRGWLGAPKDP